MDYRIKADQFRDLAAKARAQAVEAPDPEIRNYLADLAEAYEEISRHWLELAQKP